MKRRELNGKTKKSRTEKKKEEKNNALAVHV
jgi:hypothetical protein